MKLQLRQALIYALAMSMVFGFVLIKSVNIVEANDGTIEIDNTETGYSGEIKPEYQDLGVGIYKFEISEYGETYDLLVDAVNNKYFVNNIELSLEEYNKLVEEQMMQIQNDNNKDASILTLADDYPENTKAIDKYEEIHEKYEEEIQNHVNDNHVDEHSNNIGASIFTVGCTFCSLRTMSVPTTNYKTTEYGIGYRSNKMAIALTAGAIAALAAYATWGLSELARTVASAFLATLGVSLVTAEVNYYAYQSFHNVCPKAVKERHKITIIDQKTGKLQTSNRYTYFYSSKPY